MEGDEADSKEEERDLMFFAMALSFNPQKACFDKHGRKL